MESSDLRKYFFYALGEILLVVLGILIALGINNWNQNRSNSASAWMALSVLKDNVVGNLDQMHDLNKELDSIISQTNRLIDILKGVRVPADNAPEYFFQALAEFSLQADRSAFQTLSNSGGIAYLPQDIQQAVQSYYVTLDQLAYREDISNTYVQLHYEPFVVKNYNQYVQYTGSSGVFEDIYKGDTRGIPKFDLNDFVKDREMEMHLVARNFQSRRTRTYYDEAINKAAALINLIE